MRTDLHAVLLAALGEERCRLDVRVDVLDQSGDKVVARAGGTTLAGADLAIAADGVRSAIGTSLIGNPPAFCGYVGVLGVGRSDGEDRPGMAEEIWAERDRFGLFDAAGGRRYWFHMCPALDSAAAVALDHAVILGRAERFPARVWSAVAATDPASLIALPITARAPPRRLGRGRVICIGDSAHAMEPNQGQGACQGIEDAWALGVLARRLAPDAILPELERLRLARIRRAMFDSAFVGRAAHSSSAVVRGAARAMLRLPPRIVARRQFLDRIAPPRYC
jgi:2-polyprenyl-6-methoxyphenol hydroxylase-like FAD-dependent oxidoreductase